LAPEATAIFSAVAAMPNSDAHPARGGLAELGQAQARAVPGAVLADGPDAGVLGVRRARERAVADLQLDDVLAPRLQRPGDGQDGEGGLRGEVAGPGC
jgi:hypothetical protein